MQDINKALDEADFATKTEEICLKGSLVNEWQQAELRVAQAHDALNAGRESGMPIGPLVVARDEALAAFHAVQERMHQASITFTLSGVDEATWKATILRFPPREGNIVDQIRGFDGAAGGGDVIRTVLIDPVLDDATWTRLLKKLTDGQFKRLLDTATDLNSKDDGAIPFSYAVSEVIRSSGETSSAPSTSASAPDVSGDGSPQQTTPASGTSSPAT